MRQLIVFAGLPGTGKTTLATLLARQLGAVLLNKDEVRATLFSPELIEYSDRQNDFCMEIIYQLAGYHLQQQPARPVIIDGRTYSKRRQVEALLSHVRQHAWQLVVIECSCSAETMRQRVQLDAGLHIAVDRTVDMAESVRANADPLTLDRLQVQTDVGTTAEHLEMIAEYCSRQRNKPV